MTVTVVTGTIASVQRVVLGDELVADALTAATTITVDDAVDFDPVNGGTVSINGALYVYTDVDEDTGVMTLASGLIAGASAGDRVDVWDTVTSTAATEWRALVDLGGDVDNADLMNASVALPLVPVLLEGIRDGGKGEVCVVQRADIGDEWVVTDLPGRTPQVSAETFLASGSFSKMLWWLGQPGAAGSGSGALLASICAAFANDQYQNPVPSGITLWPGSNSDSGMNRIIFPCPAFAAPGETDPTKPHSKIEGLFDLSTATLRLVAAAYQNSRTPTIELITQPADPTAAINVTADRVTLTASGIGSGGAPSRVRVGAPFALGTNGPIGSYLYEEVGLDAQSFASSSTSTTAVNLTLLHAKTDYASAWNLTTGIWTCPEDGIYEWSALVKFGTWVTGSRLILFLARNGGATGNAFTRFDGNPQGTSVAIQSIAGRRWFVAGDTVQLQVAQVTGGAASIDTTGESAYISVRRCP